MELSVTTMVCGARTVVQVAGEIDVSNAEDLRAHLLQQIRAGQHHLVVDLQAVAFMDSTGVGVLAAVHRRAYAQHGCLRLVCTVAPIVKILRITGLTPVLPVHATLVDALATGPDR